MATLGFREARQCVLGKVGAAARDCPVETVALGEAGNRVLAQPVAADRDYPALARSLRDGFAIRARDVPGRLRVAGEVRAGERFQGEVGEGEAVEIMTGAPMPRGADAVVMVEHVAREGEYVVVDRAAETGQFVNPQGSEARGGERLLEAGELLEFSRIALLAAVGKAAVKVFRKPCVAILATGDEIVEVSQTPDDAQVRNTNAHSLAEQVRRAGGIAEILPVARDTEVSTRNLVERGLASDLLLLSGGVSAGKYDVVEPVLRSLGAEFYFDRVLIRPGQPLVFGKVRDKFFFGLPGNPASTMVTFEVFARAAVELLGGRREAPLPFTLARLTAPFHHQPGLTRFLPARLSSLTAEITPLAWQGSSDVPGLARANAFLVADAACPAWQAGDLIEVLLK